MFLHPSQDVFAGLDKDCFQLADFEEEGGSQYPPAWVWSQDYNLFGQAVGSDLGLAPPREQDRHYWPRDQLIPPHLKRVPVSARCALAHDLLDHHEYLADGPPLLRLPSLLIV